jgi:NAD(P)-dependent dehydrogenase (short-subunit alcohol dehydrogenase family)
MEISGASAIVTGGAGGLGGATVRRLVAAGAKVVIADLNTEKAEEMVKELGDAVAYVKTDITSESSVQEALDKAASMGPVRISVAVHGGFGGGGRTLKADGTPHSLEDFRNVIDPYLVGTFNVLRLAAAAISKSEPLEDGEHGVIINTASIAGYEGTIGQVAYAAAKAGVIGLTIAAARDLAVAGIRVVTIAPGTFITPAYGDDLEAVEAYWAPAIPFPKRMGQPVEYAKLVQSIVENSYLNGEVIRIDGAIRFGPKSPK